MIDAKGHTYVREEKSSIAVLLLLGIYVLSELEHHPFRILDLIYLILISLLLVRQLLSLYANVSISKPESVAYMVLIVLSISFLPRFKTLQHPF